MMTAKTMVDTNVLLRATIVSFPEHARIKQLVDAQIEASVELWISRQIIREYISQVTRPQVSMNPLTPESVEKQIQLMRGLFKIGDETEAVTIQLLNLIKEFPTGGKQIHDANIVATMLVYEVNTLLTINVIDMKRFENRIKLQAVMP